MASVDRFTISCPTRIIFGVGAAADLVNTLPRNAKAIVLVTGASGIASAPVLEELQRSGFATTQIKCTGEPSVLSINAALGVLAGSPADVVIACGGGSVIDTGKVLAFLLSHDLRMQDDFDQFDVSLLARPCSIPCIALPTTAGTGAEVTANAVVLVPSKKAKISLRGRALNPAVAIVDPSLMRTGPAAVVLPAGLDAITQVIEAYTSQAATPFSDRLSGPSIEIGLNALRDVVEGNDNAAWNDLAWVSLTSGMALANSGLGAAHGLAAVVGGRYDAPHGALCGRFLVPVLRQNLMMAASGSTAQQRHLECIDTVSRVFPPVDGMDQLSGFTAWIDDSALPRLADWGMEAAGFYSLAEEAVQASSSKKNAVSLSQQEFVQILTEAL